MGPVKRVSGSTAITFPEREISSEPKRGTMIQVNTPTHVAATLDFASGAIGTVVMSFDVWGHSLPPIQIHGTTGSLNVPDPNGFGGPVQALRAGTGWTDVPLTHGYAENSRGLGVADMAVAMRTGRKARAGGDITFHVLDVMHAVHEASERGVAIELQSSCQMPEPLPMDLRPGKVDP
jgi:predicted dehydrogenase